MNKQRTLAIIGIALPIVTAGVVYGLWAFLAANPSIYEVVDDLMMGRTAFSETAAVAARGFMVLYLVISFVGFNLYPLFYYLTVILEGIKNKLKEPIILALIGCIFGIGDLIFDIFSVMADRGMGVDTNALLAFLGILHIPYTIGFSIVMLVRSFKKAEIEA